MKQNTKQATKFFLFLVTAITLSGAFIVHEINNSRNISKNTKNYNRAVQISTGLITLAEQIEKFYQTKINVVQLTEIQLKFDDTAAYFKQIEKEHQGDATVQKAILISQLFRDACEHKVQAIAAILSRNSTAALIKNSQNKVKTERAARDFGTIALNFFEKNKQHLKASEREAISSYLVDKFSTSLHKYFDQRAKTNDSSQITMPLQEWPPVYIYLSVNDLT